MVILFKIPFKISKQIQNKSPYDLFYGKVIKYLKVKTAKSLNTSGIGISKKDSIILEKRMVEWLMKKERMRKKYALRHQAMIHFQYGPVELDNVEPGYIYIGPGVVVKHEN